MPDITRKIVLLPSSTYTVGLVVPLARAFEALSTIGPETPFTHSVKGRGIQTISWPDANIVVNCQLVPGTINPCATVLMHRYKGKVFYVHLWRHFDLAVRLDDPNSSIMDFASRHSVISPGCLSVLEEYGRPSAPTLGTLITNVLAAYPECRYQDLSSLKRPGGRQTSFYLNTDPDTPPIYGDIESPDETLLPDVVLRLPRFAGIDAGPHDDPTRSCNLRRQILVPQISFDPLEIMRAIPVLDRLADLLEASLSGTDRS